MHKLFLTCLFACFITTVIKAQQNLIYVKLDTWARDERFDKMINPLAFYFTENDTIFSYDVENLKEPKPTRIIKPEGYKSYAYGYLFYTGVTNSVNPGMMNLLLTDVKEKQPRLFIDRNNNFDFTDDGESVLLPPAFNTKDSVIITLNRLDKTEAGIAVQLSRINFVGNRYAYKDMLNEYYEFFYKDRKFVGIDYSLREQRYVVRSGVFKTETDSFQIALLDVNSNGLYSDMDTDRVIIANLNDSVFDSRNDLHAFTLSKNKADQYIERNGEQYEIIHIDAAGKYMTLKRADETQQFDKIPAGKKIPKFSFTDWEGKKRKIKKFKRKEVFIYYTGTSAKNFSNDTITLREIVNKHGSKIAVICFLDVNKSYELKIFGMYSNLNWIAAFKDKYVIKELKLRGLPSSLWVEKKRRVKKYNITPQQLLAELSQHK